MGGVFEVKVAQHLVQGGAQVISPLPVLPTGIQHGRKFLVLDQETNQPVINTKYRAISDGRTIEGITNEEGLTEAIYGNADHPVTLEILKNE